jgi:hypothetical protein
VFSPKLRLAPAGGEKRRPAGQHFRETALAGQPRLATIRRHVFPLVTNVEGRCPAEDPRRERVLRQSPLEFRWYTAGHHSYIYDFN